MNCVKLTYNVRGPEIESTFQLLLYIYNRHVYMSLYKNRYYYSFLQKFSFEKISRIITWHYNVHVPKQGTWFPTSYVMVVFVFSEFRGYCCFVDIGGIDYKYCLNSLISLGRVQKCGRLIGIPTNFNIA